MIQCFIMEDQQIRETVRKSIPCLYYGKSGDILQEEKYFFTLVGNFSNRQK